MMYLHKGPNENTDIAFPKLVAGAVKAGWLAAGLFLSPVAGAAVIDLFVNSPQSVALEATPSGRAQAAPVSLTSGLFDSRGMTLQYGTQQLAVTEGLMSYQVTPPAAGFSGNANGYFNLSYTSVDPVNLLGGGDTAIRLLVSSCQLARPYFFSFYLGSGRNQESYSLQLPGGSSTSFIIDVPLSAFAKIDLTAVDRLGIDAGRLPVGSSFQLAGIVTVPEPAVLTSLAPVALIGLGRRRRS